MNEADNNSALPQRHRPTHQSLNDEQNRSIIVFLTVCTKDRRPILANAEAHRQLQAAWAVATHWIVGRYVLMPDHIHLFCAPGLIPPSPLPNWVRHWKTAVCKAAKAEAGTFWQTDFWDTQLRRRDNYAAKWEYVRNNPVRAGLVTRPDEWPFQGEPNALRWHE